MRRLSQPKFLRNISLTAIYKYLSGYGEQHILALMWLGFAMIMVFPVLYLVSGNVQDPIQALLRSLEVSTFLEKQSQTTTTVPGRFIEGFQRIFVPFQAGLFLLAIKQQFGRK